MGWNVLAWGTSVTSTSALRRAAQTLRRRRAVLRVDGQRIAVAVHGVDEARLVRYVFNLLTQAGDRVVDRAGVGSVWIAPDRSEQFVSRHDAVRPFCQVLQDLEVAVGEVDL